MKNPWWTTSQLKFSQCLRVSFFLMYGVIFPAWLKIYIHITTVMQMVLSKVDANFAEVHKPGKFEAFKVSTNLALTALSFLSVWFWLFRWHFHFSEHPYKVLVFPLLYLSSGSPEVPFLQHLFLEHFITLLLAEICCATVLYLWNWLESWKDHLTAWEW